MDEIKYNQKQFNTQFYLSPEEDMITSLYSIVDDYRNGILLKPPHQRDFIWIKYQRKEWVERLKDRRRRRPIGSIVTYQINNGKPSPIYINDGFQRVNATIEYLNDPSAYGDTKDDAEMLIRSINMPKQHRLYETQDDALIDFQQVNRGTSLTPYEFCKGILTYMPNYGLWEPLIDELHQILPFYENRVTKRRYKIERIQEHKLFRHDYSFLYRYLTKSKLLLDFTVTLNDTRYMNLQAPSSIIERLLRDELQKYSPEIIQSDLDILRGIVERETANLISILGEMKLPGISPTLFRWIMDLSIWKRFNNVDNSTWEEFIKKLLESTNGKSMVFELVNGVITRKYVINLAKLSCLRGVSEIVGSNIYLYKKERRKSRKEKPAGFDESHILPFSIYGDGDTIIEPSGRNRSRGSKPIQVTAE